MLEKIIEYGLYLLAFVLPLGARWIIKAGETEYATYSLYGTDILLVLLLMLFIVKSVIAGLTTSSLREIWRSHDNPENRSETLNPGFRLKAGMTISGLVLISGISVFFALNKPLALYKFGWLVAGIGLYWLLSRAKYSKIKLSGSLLAGLMIEALLGIWQFFNQAAFANKWLGLAAHRAADLGAAVIETAGADGAGERWLRAYGGFDHPNIFGGAMAIGMLLLIVLAVKNIKFKKTLFRPLLIIFSAALFFSFSRAAALALAGGILVLAVSLIIKKDWPAQRILAPAVLIIGTAGFILFLLYPNLIFTRLSASQRLEIMSLNERAESLKNSWPIIKNNWLLGVGPGNYGLALKRQFPGRDKYFYQPAHSGIILALAEVGLAGLIILAYWLIKLFKADYGLPVLTALIILFLLDHWLWSLHFGALFFWLVIGLAENFQPSVRTELKPPIKA